MFGKSKTCQQGSWAWEVGDSSDMLTQPGTPLSSRAEAAITKCNYLLHYHLSKTNQSMSAAFTREETDTKTQTSSSRLQP